MWQFIVSWNCQQEIGIICDNYKTVDIDLTIVLTHIGFEEDKKLAKLLMPEWGVDIIIGGHSHTIPEQPEKVNNVLIVQAGTGTDQIGRFDITVDADTNMVHDYQWKIVPINDRTCPRDPDIEKIIMSYKEETEFYQVSSGIKIIYDYKTHEFEEFLLNGKPVLDSPVLDTDNIRIGMQIFHYSNMEDFFDVTLDETASNEAPKVIATSDYSILEEYLTTHLNLLRSVEGRLEVKNGPDGYPNDI